jgi:murein DD-endopeptidase MepM/ murein hydrolase activator NlpD
MATPTGIKNKNYLNVKNGASPWLDTGGKNSKTDSRGHAIFTDPAYGIRAGILLLRTYFFTHNLRTIAEILARWAPSTDTIGSLPGAPQNSPLEYSQFVSGRMGIGYNQRLEIFNEDKSIGNVGQLRDLFFAMAAYEVGGGFKVPVGEFNAALEIVQPGIKTDGTDTQHTNTLLANAPTEAATATAKWQIGASVGRRDLGAVNEKADVETVQQMLRNAAMILGDPRVDTGGIDGKIDKDPKKSTTIQAIMAFQSRFFTKPDGLIEVDGRTWLELLRVLGTSSNLTPTAPPAGTAAFYFPFAQLPASNWTSAPRSFAANRDGGARAHAGCDLYFPKGTIIHAIAAGTVVRGPYPFYAETFAIEIDHGTFLARYGEVQSSTFVHEGDVVAAGQPIAKVGHLVGISVPSDMLHLELYDKTGHGPLTVGAAQSKKTSDGRPFMRRSDLIDPTPKLNEWRNNLPGGAPAAPVAQPAVAAAAAATGAPSGVPAVGFCIYLKRERQEKRSSMTYSRTVGSYKCFWNGAEIAGLSGQIVERGGPGDNTTEIGDNQNLRIEQGTYRLAIQDGTRYKTYNYDTQDTSSSGSPKPGILLEDTDERFAILIHPGSDYVSSVGCLNPSTGLTDAASKINFADSRTRVIALIDSLKTKLGGAFPKSGVIPNAVIVIKGEPK